MELKEHWLKFSYFSGTQPRPSLDIGKGSKTLVTNVAYNFSYLGSDPPSKDVRLNVCEPEDQRDVLIGGYRPRIQRDICLLFSSRRRNHVV